jgi:hypothetical protein
LLPFTQATTTRRLLSNVRKPEDDHMQLNPHGILSGAAEWCAGDRVSMSPPFPPTRNMAKLEGKFHATVMTPTSFCGFCLQHCRVRVEMNCIWLFSCSAHAWKCFKPQLCSCLVDRQCQLGKAFVAFFSTCFKRQTMATRAALENEYIKCQSMSIGKCRHKPGRV